MHNGEMAKSGRECNDCLREAFDEVVFVSDLAALVLCVLLCCCDLFGRRILLASDLLKYEYHAALGEQ